MVGFVFGHMKQITKKESVADVVIIHTNMNQIQKQVGGGGRGLKALPLTTTLFIQPIHVQIITSRWDDDDALIIHDTL